jgi:DNA mismatch repair ATPase MutS
MYTPPGKGTSAKDGSALSGALLEHLDQRRISGIFSTHLHELFRLPLRLKSVTDKKMGFAVDDAGEFAPSTRSFCFISIHCCLNK